MIITEFHFLRPAWLLLLIPLFLIVILLWRQNAQLFAWRKICDPHLLQFLIKKRKQTKRHQALVIFLFSSIFFCLALAGPSWIRLPVPSYKLEEPKVLLLDMSNAMLQTDLKPNRLTRAKFKLHDLFTYKGSSQLGLIAFTNDAFVVSPITEDAKTIDSLLSSLTPEIMPVDGYELSNALTEGAKLIKQAGFNGGQLLVLTATPPDQSAIDMASRLTKEHIFTSVMPLVLNKNDFFQSLATAGRGQLIPFTDTSDNLYEWSIKPGSQSSYKLNEDNDIPVWRDEGRWFVLPGLFLLIPIFRRNWLQRMES